MMITYIGLDLGVDTSVVTNSASVIMGMKPPIRTNIADEDGKFPKITEGVLDIRRSRDINDSESVV
jgi:hypothetical protein